MNAWLAFLFTLSLIILVHEWGHFFMARRVGVKVERFSLGFGPRLFGIVRRGTEYVVCLLPFGGYVKMAGESPEESISHPWEYRAKSVGQRMLIVAAGPLVNYGLGFLLFFLIFMAGSPVVTSRIGEILEGYPASSSGLKAGDRILSVNGRPVASWEEVTRWIHAETSAVELVVDRTGERMAFAVVPRVKEAKNLLGARVRIGMVGITPSDEVEIRRYSPPRAFVKSAERVVFLTQMTVQAIGRMLTRELSVKESVTGPIGIFYITSSVAQQGFVSLLQLVAVLSTSLGFFNLLPVPVLDGGHLFFLCLERLKGKPVSTRAQEMMTRLGVGLLVFLLVVVTYNDLVKFKIVEKFLPR